MSRRLLAENKPKNFARRRVAVLMPDRSMILPVRADDLAPTPLAPAELRPDDLVIAVRFNLGPVRNPRALETVKRAEKPIERREPHAQPLAPSHPQKISAAPPESQQTQSCAPPESENPVACAHPKMILVSENVRRCPDCGFQKPEKRTVIGFSFAALKQLRNRFEN